MQEFNISKASEFDGLVEQLRRLKKPDVTVLCPDRYARMCMAAKQLETCCPGVKTEVCLQPDFFLGSVRLEANLLHAILSQAFGVLLSKIRMLQIMIFFARDLPFGDITNRHFLHFRPQFCLSPQQRRVFIIEFLVSHGLYTSRLYDTTFNPCYQYNFVERVNTLRMNQYRGACVSTQAPHDLWPYNCISQAISSSSSRRSQRCSYMSL